MVKAPILSAPRYDQPFHVTGDASGFCIGIILWQYNDEEAECPIYYASRQMNSAERNYTATERECLPLIFACKKFCHYLLGYDIVFHTDHDAIKYLVNKTDLSGRIARWVLLLQEFKYEIKVKAGKSNANADYLSRLEEEGGNDVPLPDEFPDEQLFKITVQPNEYEDIRKYLETGEFPEEGKQKRQIFAYKVGPYTLRNGILFKLGADQKLRRCVTTVDIPRVLYAYHTGMEGGHFAAEATVKKIRTAGYWWTTMIKDVYQYIQACQPCQHAGRPRKKDHWPLTPIIPLAPFAKWGIDFMGPISPLTKTHRNKYICMTTEYATKWVESRATRKDDAETAGRFFFEQVIMRFGPPQEVVSDRGKHFVNRIIYVIVHIYFIRHRLTTPYNPKANGSIERANGIVGKALAKLVEAHKTDWDRKLYSATYAYNTTEKSTTGYSPFFLVYGQIPMNAIELFVKTSRTVDNVSPIEELAEEARLEQIDALEEARFHAHEQTEAVQIKQKLRWDKKLSKVTIMSGDIVLVYDSRHEKFPGKLHIRWLGPFQVTRIHENGSLELETLEGEPLATRINGSRVRKYYVADALGTFAV